ncbi:Outer membrane protein (porin) [Andreprevotia lacus DSM 23236]|jgi:predicted porin|uniref:Outer membrane protein (Porin) n=1 Tax=Andreprevotia lacus DSM 23236 TaxID=1121001 RepID=A0A1W1XE08_9NEIS|nr:porin [Andreprevotia lacus]SMC21888.1 Outer membrane protein (porin) [Andreprevotia lacus DSM 23236]
MKKLIAAAVAAAFVGPLAYADVTIYGSFRYSLDFNHYSNDAAGKTYDNKFTGWDQSTRIGFKGVDKWDDSSWATIWQVETSIGGKNAAGNKLEGGDGGTNTGWGTRNTFIGLQSADYGTIRTGKYDNAYKTLLTSSNLSSIFDNFSDDGDFKGKGAVFAQLASRVDNSLSYDSPVWSGFQVRGTYGADGAAGFGQGAGVYGLSGLYTNGGLVAGVTWQHAEKRKFSQVTGISDATGTTTKTTTFNPTTPVTSTTTTTSNFTEGASVNGFEAALGYKFDGAQIGFGWEHIEDKQPAVTNSWNNFAIAGNYSFNPKLQVQGVYAWTKDYLGVSGNDGQQASLGVVYQVTKQTRLYSYLVYLNNKAAKGSSATFSNNSGSLSVAAGQNATQLSAGIRTDF